MATEKSTGKASGGQKQGVSKSATYETNQSGQTRHTDKTTSSKPTGNPPGHKK